MSRNQHQNTVLVTGGAQGLGREICQQMATRQWRIGIADLDEENARKTAIACGLENGMACFIPVDLGLADGPREMIEATVRHFGRLDVLINCAAYATAEAFAQMSAGAWERTLMVNVRGIALAIASVTRQMTQQGGGRIINVTSPASRMALPNYAAYAASKAALESLTRSAAVALAPKNIRVNSVAPGMMDTTMQLKTEEVLAVLEEETDMTAFMARRTARIPVGRRATCQEVAEAVVWLATDAPNYITAERLNISGGLDKD